MIIYNERYEYVRTLGSGTYGRVLCVRDQKTNHFRAMKLIVKDHSSAKKTLKNEFQILKDFKHPHLANVFDIGEISDGEHNQIYLISEMIDGEDFFSWSETKNINEIENIFLQLLNTVRDLHEKSICHGDLKPQNLLICYDGSWQLKMIDFGFASSTYNKNTKSAGTHAYMAPEIQLNNPISVQSDIFSLGVVFYKILTRTMPQFSNFLYPSQIQPHVPEFYDVMIKKMLSHNLETRYTCLQDILKDWQMWHNDETIDTSYAFETHDSDSFYLRNKEMESFSKIYHDRIFNKKFNTHPIIKIIGEPGVGKNIFLNSLIKIAQNDLIPVYSWKNFQNHLTFDSLPQQALIYATENEIDEEALSYIEAFFTDSPFLFLVVSDRAGKSEQGQVIQINPFTSEQTENYLKHILKLNTAPPQFLKSIYSRSQGFIEKINFDIKQLLSKNLLRDKTGLWTEKMMFDLEYEIVENLSHCDLWPQNQNSERIQIQNIIDSDLSQTSTIKSYFVTAQEFRKNSETKKARQILDELLNLSALNANNELFYDVVHEWAELHLESHEIGTVKSKIKNILDTQSPDVMHKIKFIELLGMCEFYSKNYKIAENHFLQIEQLAKTHPENSYFQMIAFSRLSLVKFYLGHTDEAFSLARDALHIFRTKLNKSEQIQLIRLNIDEIYYQKQNYQEALDCLNDFHNILKNNQHRIAYPITLYKLARVHLKMKHFDLAHSYLLTCLDEFKKRRSTQWLSHVYNELGILFKNQNQFALAEAHYKHALDLQRLVKKDESLYLIAQNLGNLLLSHKNFRDAEKYFIYSFINLQKNESSTLAQQGLLTSALALAEINMKIHNYEKVRFHLKEAERLLTLWPQHPDWQIFWQHSFILGLETQQHHMCTLAWHHLNVLTQSAHFNSKAYETWKSENPIPTHFENLSHIKADL